MAATTYTSQNGQTSVAPSGMQTTGNGWGWGDADQAVGLNYQYHNGDTEDQFIKRNAFSQQSGYGAAYFANPVLGFAAAFRGRKQYEKMRAQYEAAQDQADTANRAAALHNESGSLYGLTARDDQQRGAALGNLDNAFNDGTRQQSRENEYSAGLANATAGLAEQNRNAGRANAFDQLRAGRLGGSVDIENQGRLSAALQSGVYDASSRGMRRLYDANTADTNQFYAQRRALLSGDPQRAAQYTAMGQAIGNDVERNNRLDDYLSSRATLNRENADNNSQLVGGLGYAAAGAVGQRYAYRGY